MPDRSSKRPRDLNRRAWEIAQEATGEKPKAEEVDIVEQAIKDGKNPHAVLLGRKGGQKGGKARAAKMTKEERSEAAKKAARARWERSSS